MSEEKKIPLIIAHRGASAHAPENTLASFLLAVEHKADAIELDAKLTADKEIVVIHDQTLDRTTNGIGRVKDKKLKEIKLLDAGFSYSPDFRGEKIPTLLEVFEAVGEKLMINVELTNYSTPRDSLPDLVVELVRKMKLEDSILFSSFNPLNLMRVRRLMPEAKVAILASEGAAGSVSRSFIGKWFSPDYFHPHYQDVSRELIEREHKAGRKVNVWTVDAPSEMQKLVQWKIDGIITDDPLLARHVVGEK